MNEKKKVLIVNEPLEYGGSDLVAVRLQENLDKEKFECAYCVRHSYKGPLEPYIEQQGIRVIHQPDDSLGYFASYKYYLELFEKEHFDIVHSHLPFYSGFVMLAAKKCRVKKRITHSHFSQPLILDPSKIKQLIARVYRSIMRIILKKCTTDMIACSKESGEFLFGRRTFNKSGIVLNNGIDYNRYKYDEKIRQAVRQELNIPQNAVVLGHIGRMYYIKNQKFLLDVFNEFHKKHSNSYLLLVGEGEEYEDTKEKAHSLDLDDCVIFTGIRKDADRLLNAMDCFVFPSVHEGFPLTLIEAQANCLSCLVSDTVNKKTALNKNVEFASLKESPYVWAEKAEKMLEYDRKNVNNSRIVNEYAISNISKQLEKIYLD